VLEYDPAMQDAQKELPLASEYFPFSHNEHDEPLVDPDTFENDPSGQF
jgi:hypothetical protein